MTAAFVINVDKAMAYYGLTNGGRATWIQPLGGVEKQVAADGLQRCGSVQEAIWHAATGATVYEYQFDRPLPGRTATNHGGELPYVFGNFLMTATQGVPFTDADRKVSNDVQIYWTNFAKTVIRTAPACQPGRNSMPRNARTWNSRPTAVRWQRQGCAARSATCTWKMCAAR